MKRKSLSICIPTYNRDELLDIQLAKITDQIIQQNLLDCVEIIVSNNASTDSTNSVIEKYKSQDLSIIHTTQSQNIGLYNIVAVTKYATGKFIWIVSDDDIITDNAINYLVKIISTEENVKIITGSVLGQKTFSNIIIEDKNRSLQIIGNNISYLSFFVFKNQDVQYEMPIDSLIPHSYIFLDVMSKPGKHIFSSTPLVIYRANNETSYSFFKAFYVDMYDLYLYAIKLNFDKKTLNTMISKLTLSILGRLNIIQNSNIKINNVDLVEHFKIKKSEVFDILRVNFPNAFHFEKNIIRTAILYPKILYYTMFFIDIAMKARRKILNLRSH